MSKNKNKTSSEERIFKILGGGLKFLNLFGFNLSGKFLYWLWCHPIKFKPSTRELRFREKMEMGEFEANGHEYKYYTMGEGPIILLMHGWDGRGTQMTSFITPIVEAGHKAVIFDAHGHGESYGSQTDGVLISNQIKALAKKVGGFKGIISHSFGGSFAMVSAVEEVSIEKSVLIAPPQNMESSFQKVATRLDCPKKPQQYFRERFERTFPNSWNRFSIDQQVAQLSDVKGLVIQDKDDDFVLMEEGIAVHEAWEGSELMITEGLGHRKILRSKDVIARAAQFITT